MRRIFTIIILGFLIQSCSDNKIEKKGFQVSEISEDEDGEQVVGLRIDSLQLETRPRNVLVTSHPAHRLTPIYKVNYDKKGHPFIGSNRYHQTWQENDGLGNNWNNNFIPGFEALYGYNLVNISHFNHKTKIQTDFFDEPVLIKTLYYPTFSKDTLNYEPIKRDFHMISVYDEDSNNDGFVNVKDLRRLYWFDINGGSKKNLIPKNYSVMSSEYDFTNDYMYIFAKIDGNNNGQMELEEETHIFWIDLNNPENKGIHYKKK